MLINQTKKYLQQHLRIYFAWSILSILVGFGMWIENQAMNFFYFAMMTHVWGWVNLLCGIGLYLHVRKHTYAYDSSKQQKKIQHHIEKMLLLNVGLDMGYIMSGVLLLLFSNLTNNWLALWGGFGWAVLLQGVFMLLLDISFYALHFQNRC